LETKLIRGKDPSAVSFRWTDDPSAPAITVREDGILKNYPMTYRDLTDAMTRRYENFLVNREFHKLGRELEREKNYAIVRFLHPETPNTSKQRLYNATILQEFDKYYKRRKKP
jgi:hypothetical protein